MAMPDYLLRFVSWTKIKVRLYLKSHQTCVYFDEREIWWAHLGANIGYEQDGKNENFERPVLILRKFGKHAMWVLPQTSKAKSGIYYHQYEFEGKPYAVILSQIRTISSKRLIRKIRTYPKDDFEIIKNKVIALIKNDPRH